MVDDDWMNREIMEARLVSAGFTVLTAHNGEEALKLVTQQPPDLILLDVRMQGLSGYDVCGRLKTQTATRSIPILLVTALDTEEARERSRIAGADGLIAKSCPSTLLLDHVHQLLHIKQA